MKEVSRAKELKEIQGKPIILPIRINFSLDLPLNYDLRSYLQRIQHREWHSENDTGIILKEILRIFSTCQEPDLVEPVITKPALDNSPDSPPLPVADPDSLRETGIGISSKSHLYMGNYP